MSICKNVTRTLFYLPFSVLIVELHDRNRNITKNREKIQFSGAREIRVVRVLSNIHDGTVSYFGIK